MIPAFGRQRLSWSTELTLGQPFYYTEKPCLEKQKQKQDSWHWLGPGLGRESRVRVGKRGLVSGRVCRVRVGKNWVVGRSFWQH